MAELLQIGPLYLKAFYHPVTNARHWQGAYILPNCFVIKLSVDAFVAQRSKFKLNVGIYGAEQNGHLTLDTWAQTQVWGERGKNRKLIDPAEIATTLHDLNNLGGYEGFTREQIVHANPTFCLIAVRPPEHKQPVTQGTKQNTAKAAVSGVLAVARQTSTTFGQHIANKSTEPWCKPDDVAGSGETFSIYVPGDNTTPNAVMAHNSIFTLGGAAAPIKLLRGKRTTVHKL